MNEEIIQIVIKGGSDKNTPLLAVADAFKELHHAIDKSYLSLSGKDKISKSDRDLYKIVATDIKSGSVIADLLIIIPPLVQTAFTFHSMTSGLDAKNIWELTKNSFKFLKTVSELRHKGQKPSIVQSNNPSALNIINQGGQVTVNVGSIVSENAVRSEPHIKKLAKIVDDKNVREISALDGRKEGIILTAEENKIFNPETFINENKVEIICKIYRLDVETKTGRLRVLEGEYQGEYSFEIIGDRQVQQIQPYIYALCEEYSTIVALREIIRHPTGDEALAGFRLIRIIDKGKGLF